MISNQLIDLLVATGIGLIIGLEREFKESIEKDHFAGIRTYPLTSILGFVVTVLGQQLGTSLLLAALPAIVLLIGVVYYSRTMKGHAGLTSEIALLITFILGCLSAVHLVREALSIAVLTTVLLSLKGPAKALIDRITQDEIYAFIKFAVLTLLVLPFLPNEDLGPNGLLNPFEIGIIVVIISSLSFVGYILVKFTGSEKGILMTAFFGGIFSSTSVTWVFSTRSKEVGNLYTPHYAAGIVVASSIMFLRVAVVTLIFNQTLFMKMIVPCLIMAATGFISFWLMRRGTPRVENQQKLEVGNPLDIANALLFGALFTAISLMVYYADMYFGDRGLILSGIVSGFLDVDAITISMARYAGAEKLNLMALVITSAMLSNTLVKYVVILIKGSSMLRQKTAFPFLAMILTGLIYAVLGQVFT